MLFPLISLIVATAATAAVVAAAAAVAAVVAAAAAISAFAGFSFFDYDGTAVEFLVVQAVDSSLPFLVVGHFNKSKTFGFSCEFVHNDFYGIHFSVLLKSILKIHLLSVEV